MSICKRAKPRGQAAVEMAIITPLTLFAILGIVQLSMMMHARYVAQYAAYAAARAASVHDGNCHTAVTAALIGVAPMVGRTKDGASFINIWNSPGSSDFTLLPRPALNTNVYPGVGGLPIVKVRMSHNYVGMSETDPTWNNGGRDADFDIPDSPIMITYEVVFNYEMRIPFANAVIHESWAGANYFGPEGTLGINALMGPRQRDDAPDLSAEYMPYYVTARQDHRYIIPIKATATLRMMSNPFQSYWSEAKGGCQKLEGTLQ
jgi:hypothetical protein